METSGRENFIYISTGISLVLRRERIRDRCCILIQREGAAGTQFGAVNGEAGRQPHIVSLFGGGGCSSLPAP